MPAKMDASSNIGNTDKFALIYEFNKDSPLFAYVAQKELESGNLERAFEIITDGIKKYPEYPTAYFIYSDILYAQGKISEAKEIISKGADLLNSKDTFEFYMKKNQREIDINNNKSTLGTEKDRTVDEKSDLEELAKKLDAAKIENKEVSQQIIDEHRKLSSQTHKIVSETLAGIYFDQGNWQEALEVYTELIKLRPQRAEIYRNKINIIEDKIGKKKK